MDQAEVIRRPRPRPVRALIKAILHSFVKLFIVTGRTIRRYPLPSLIVMVVLVGSFFLLTSGALAFPINAGINQPLNVAGNTPAANPAAVESFLRGQREHNPVLMWDAMSDEHKAALEQRGLIQQAQQEMQQAVEKRRLEGVTFTDYRYIAGTSLNEGRSVHLYIVTLSVPSQQGTVNEQLPVTFTLDQAGKILSSK